MARQSRSPTPPRQPTPIRDVNRVILKCSKCSKLGRKTCTQQACLKCCTDEQCEPHREMREKEKEKELILEGKHALQIQAKKQRALRVTARAFHEPAFRYLGETLLIWDLRAYMSNAKWRDDAIRKSRRYVESQLYLQSYPKSFKRKQFDMDVPPHETTGGRKKKFKRVMDQLYRKSLK